MRVTTYEATVQHGRVVLPDDAHIPDNTRVYVVVPASRDAEPVRILSPRLAHREDVGDFTMQVEHEGDDARV
jgi:hypothetical protein